MTETEQAQRNRDLVRALYEASFAGDANAFSDAMLEDFEAHVPPVLPWGGVQRGPKAFLTALTRSGNASLRWPHCDPDHPGHVATQRLSGRHSDAVVRDHLKQ